MPDLNLRRWLAWITKNRTRMTGTGLHLEQLDDRWVPALFTWTYTGAEVGQWNVGANWDGGVAPANNGTNDIDVPGGTGSIHLDGSFKSVTMAAAEGRFLETDGLTVESGGTGFGTEVRLKSNAVFEITGTWTNPTAHIISDPNGATNTTFKVSGNLTLNDGGVHKFGVDQFLVDGGNLFVAASPVPIYTTVEMEGNQGAATELLVQGTQAVPGRIKFTSGDLEDNTGQLSGGLTLTVQSGGHLEFGADPNQQTTYTNIHGQVNNYGQVTVNGPAVVVTISSNTGTGYVGDGSSTLVFNTQPYGNSHLICNGCDFVENGGKVIMHFLGHTQEGQITANIEADEIWMCGTRMYLSDDGESLGRNVLKLDAESVCWQAVSVFLTFNDNQGSDAVLDRVWVTGDLSVTNDSSLTVTEVNGPRPTVSARATWNAVQADGTITGDFSSWNLPAGFGHDKHDHTLEIFLDPPASPPPPVE